jgi:hypothetical protein
MKLLEVPVHALHPTQITVGMIEVRQKMRMFRDMRMHEQRQYLAAHPVPAVRAVNRKLFITDHHHLARALREVKARHAYVVVEDELMTPSVDRFWRTMMARHWAHPINERGELRPYREIPRHVHSLRDDVYRSLAAFVREAGGYKKTPTAYADFVWADWFRARVKIGATAEDFHHAVDEGVRLAHSSDARALPGYIEVAASKPVAQSGDRPQAPVQLR